MFRVGQLVEGKVAGAFIILSLQTVVGVPCARVKPFHVALKGPGRGEAFIPLSRLSPARDAVRKIAEQSTKP